jgi:hypothetical protein
MLPMADQQDHRAQSGRRPRPRAGGGSNNVIAGTIVVALVLLFSFFFFGDLDILGPDADDIGATGAGTGGGEAAATMSGEGGAAGGAE